MANKFITMILPLVVLAIFVRAAPNAYYQQREGQALCNYAETDPPIILMPNHTLTLPDCRHLECHQNAVLLVHKCRHSIPPPGCITIPGNPELPFPACCPLTHCSM
uniref:Putative seminal fluid protein AcpC03 n=1 Tax=Calomera littoralis TaxID=285225 RepID=A0A0F7PWH8_CALLO|nr:putative seminal fluid protein AcpC03 [Calomera littoralis]